MSESTTASTGLSSQYAAQVTGDLERNVKEQERISADITALQEQLVSLQNDHSVLVNVQQALGIAATPVQPAAAPESTTVPAPREKASTEPSTGKRTRAKKAANAQSSTATKKSAPKKPASKAADAKASQPTLVELVRRHLTEQSEPHSAAEVASALDTAHPERGIKTTVVRTTLENLVAKNQAQRTKQGSSVYYTAPSEAAQTAARAQDEPQAE
ncbi:BlaI/MecI/CopY family transcriptional regulator [Streptomyces chiangmaiensis]|uniref:BlaI/MecI/CopY family transcriptional regulator n=1 Tax=Streptomyces chiangmaiensis TaxID=766497 RepID=A0ABU7FPS9_9ACTN|nr:BlaI/MecI/CopY family transcriptional regulator [Streptomyces chiangmaiensis]MED7826121.1 BlaI/MecI/CopY family transcriptional regulator [Streptomyces chiangmaiensis]